MMLLVLTLASVSAITIVGSNIPEPQKWLGPVHRDVPFGSTMVFNAREVEKSNTNKCWVDVSETHEFLLAQNGIFTSEQLTGIYGPFGPAITGARNHCGVVLNPQDRPYLHNAQFISRDGKSVFPQPFVPVLTTPKVTKFNPMPTLGLTNWHLPNQVPRQYVEQPSTYRQIREHEKQPVQRNVGRLSHVFPIDPYI